MFTKNQNIRSPLKKTRQLCERPKTSSHVPDETSLHPYIYSINPIYSISQDYSHVHGKKPTP